MPLPFPICVGCTQGAENRRLTKPGVGMAGKPKPRRGAGHRNMDCPEYDNCLDLAAKKDWKTFHCSEACPLVIIKGQGKDGPVKAEKKENDRLCECGKVTLSPNCPYCPSCMAKRSNKGKSTKKKPKAKRPRGRPLKKRPTESPGDAPKKENTTPSMSNPGKDPVGQNTALTIDFGKYSHILKQVEGLAEEELRPVDLQVVYIIKHYLNERQADG